MYTLINHHVEALLDSIPPGHVPEYDWLLQNLDQCAMGEYQGRYAHYWRLNAARLCADYRLKYFQALEAAQEEPPAIEDLAQQLYEVPTHANGRQSLQFSFATKLIHTVNPNAPIHDSLIATLYFFQEPNRDQVLGQRIATLTAFHAFLTEEYQRILVGGLLAPSIEAFRLRFAPQEFTDEKVIDSLLWAFVALLRNGGLINGGIFYG